MTKKVLEETHLQRQREIINAQANKMFIIVWNILLDFPSFFNPWLFCGHKIYTLAIHKDDQILKLPFNNFVTF